MIAPAKPALEARMLGATRPWWVDVWVRMLVGKPLGTIGAVIVVVMLVAAVLADWIAPYGFARRASASASSPRARRTGSAPTSSAATS